MQQNLVVDAGSLELGTKRFRIEPTGEFKSPEDIADVVIRPSLIDSFQAPRIGRSEAPRGARSEERLPTDALTGSALIRIRDIGTIRRGYREPPRNIMIQDGRQAIGLSITNRPGVNIVEVGRAIDQRLEELQAIYPVAVEWQYVHWQSDIVDQSITDFLISFAEAVAIVLVVLTLAMGWRMGVIIGSALVVTVLGTFLIMALFDKLFQVVGISLVLSWLVSIMNLLIEAAGKNICSTRSTPCWRRTSTPSATTIASRRRHGRIHPGTARGPSRRAAARLPLGVGW